MLLKDNFDTFDMPTTGGSVLFENWVPPDDAFVVKKLRDAGAIILGKLNLSEFASGTAHSSLGGQTLNPHDLTRSPSGSSSGTGAAIAAAMRRSVWVRIPAARFVDDVGQRHRGPEANARLDEPRRHHSAVALFDTGGPMARSVYHVAVSLGVMTGVDPADPATQKSKGKFATDYTRFSESRALKGARIGIARDFLGADPMSIG